MFFICLSSDSHYLTCRMQNCTEANRNQPFPGYIDPDSLIVQDHYVFVQVWKIHFCWLSQKPLFSLFLSLLQSLLPALHSIKSQKERKGGREGGRERGENHYLFNKRIITECGIFCSNRIVMSFFGLCPEDLIHMGSWRHHREEWDCL